MQLPDSVWLESPSLERLETGSIKDSPTGALLDLDGCDQPGFWINVLILIHRRSNGGQCDGTNDRS